MKLRVPVALIALFVSACVTNNFAPPPVSPVLITRAQSDHATAQQLTDGRVLFVHRCLECHTLPAATKYSRDDWPHLVRRMAGRADLTPDQEQSVVAYLRAATTR